MGRRSSIIPSAEISPNSPQGKPDISDGETPGARRRAHRKKMFLSAYAKVGNVSQASAAVHMTRAGVMKWRKSDPDFEREFNSCRDTLVDEMRGTLIERARAGDTTCLIFLNKCLDPKTFGDRMKHEVVINRMDEFLSAVISVLKMRIPHSCPACKTNLGLQNVIAEELLALSARMGSIRISGEQAPGGVAA